MTTIEPGILEMIEMGDLIVYRDAAGRGTSLREIIDAKRTGQWHRIRPTLIREYQALPDIPSELRTASFPKASIKNPQLMEAIRAAKLAYKNNEDGPRMQPLFSALDEAKLEYNYPGAVESHAFVDVLFKDVPLDKVEDKMEEYFPVGLLDINAKQTRLIAYTQNPRNISASKQLYASVRNVMQTLMANPATDTLVTDRLTSLLMDITKVARTHFYGTGSPLGQVGRLRRGFEIKADAFLMRAQDDLWDQVMDRDTFFSIQDSCRRIMAAPTDDPLNMDPMGLLASDQILINDYHKGNDIILKIIHVTDTADAGLPWEDNSNKGQTIMADMLILSAMHEQIKQLSNSGQSMEAFALKYAWTRVHKIKAKAEIYDIANFDTKIRNISVPPNCIMILPQIMFKISKWATSTLQRPIRPETANRSLMGYAPFKGGHEFLIERFMAEKRLILHYADNLFIWEDGKFASMDASSMEAIHTTLSIRMCLEYILTRCFGCAFNKGQLTHGGLLGNVNSWLIHSWFGQVAANSPGVLRSFLLDVPGLASGMPGTFEFNDMIMALAAHEIAKTPLDKPLLKIDGSPLTHVLNTCNALGLTMKTETHFPGTRLKRMPDLNDALEEPWTPVSEDGTICETDMLGFDTIFVKIAQNAPRCIAVLNRKRLLKAITFNKSEIRSTDLKPTTHTIIQMATLNILYLSGAWAHPDITMAIEITCRGLVGELSMSAVADDINNQKAAASITTEALARAAATIGDEDLIDESMARGLLRSMMATGLIPLAEVFRITHSPELSKELVDFCIGHPSLTGPKLTRMVGPIIIAENITKIQNFNASWVQPLITTTLRALDLLQPLLEETPKPPPATTTTKGLTNTDAIAPTDIHIPTPEEAKGTKRAGDSTDEKAWRRILTLAEHDLSPQPTQDQVMQAIIEQTFIDYELFREPILLDPVEGVGDPIAGLALAMVRRLQLPDIMAERHIDGLARLVAVGAIAPLSEQPSKRRRRL